MSTCPSCGMHTMRPQSSCPGCGEDLSGKKEADALNAALLQDYAAVITKKDKEIADLKAKIQADAYDSKADTLEHMRTVGFVMHKVLREFLTRIELHDIGKLQPEEKALFDKYTPVLKHTTYGSDEYKQYLKELKPSLDHHYATNRHHPEFWNKSADAYRLDGGMNFADLLEMMCDWYASSKRHADGDPMRSIEINQKRFGYSDETAAFMRNTMRWLLGEELVYSRWNSQDSA